LTSRHGWHEKEVKIVRTKKQKLKIKKNKI